VKKTQASLAALLIALIGFPTVSAVAAEGVLDRPTPRIIGGSQAFTGEAPWQVALIDKTEGNDFFGQFCGGSILSSTWIVTAAHCLDGGMAVRDLMVLSGTQELSTRKLSGIQAKRYIVHEAWDPATSSNDIALIELAKPISLRAGKTQAIALPSARPSNGATAVISGWGKISTNPSVYPWTTKLQVAEVQVVADATCAGEYVNNGEFVDVDIVSNLMMCASGGGFTIDTCQGDSGGPLAISVNGQWELHGITSFGNSCALAPYPGVYAEVYQYVDWVVERIVTKPTIKSLSPSSAASGTTVTMTGRGFTGTNSVRLGSIEADFTVVSDTSIRFIVPESAFTSKVTVSNASYNTTDRKDFKVLPPPGAPTIRKIRSSANVGSSLAVTGTNLGTTTTVTINGVSQTFSVISPTSLTVNIGLGTSSGYVVITNLISSVQSKSILRIR
jgi:secreted trypsin-like serine protease